MRLIKSLNIYQIGKIKKLGNGALKKVIILLFLIIRLGIKQVKI